jgi:vacuolar protein sorting-associated protein 13A/C
MVYVDRVLSDIRSNPFNISDLGKTYVKLDKVEGASDLVKVNIVINEATMRLQISQVKEQRLWPYQIKNLTDLTINFFQKVFPRKGSSNIRTR